jgi:hypothetical protein
VHVASKAALVDRQHTGYRHAGVKGRDAIADGSNVSRRVGHGEHARSMQKLKKCIGSKRPCVYTGRQVLRGRKAVTVVLKVRTVLSTSKEWGR